MRVQTAAVALGVVLSGVLFGPASPARAVPVPVGTSSTSSYNSVSPKFDTARCPSGQVVLDGSGTVTGGAGYVVMSEVNLGRTSVTVMAYEETPYSGDWSVTAHAVCGPDEDEDLVITWIAGAGTPTAKVAVVYCSAGLKLYGTGYELPGSNGHVFPTAVRPDEALSKVTVRADAHGGFTGDWNVVAYAVCGPPAPYMRLLTTRSASNSTASKAVTTEACPDGTHVHGTGAEITGGAGDVVLTTDAPSSPALTRSQAGAQERGRVTEDWSLTSYAICSS